MIYCCVSLSILTCINYPILINGIKIHILNIFCISQCYRFETKLGPHLLIYLYLHIFPLLPIARLFTFNELPNHVPVKYYKNRSYLAESICLLFYFICLVCRSANQA